MRILHFVGEGSGMMRDIKEYIVILEDEDVDLEEERAPGFKLSSNTEVDDLPTSLPLNTTLIPAR